MLILIKNAQIVNEGKIYKSDVLIENQIIKEIANNTYNRSLLKELFVFPFRQTLLFILIILHILYRAIGVVIFKR